MSDLDITQMTQLAVAPAADDVIYIGDVSEAVLDDQNKYIEIQDLFKYLDGVPRPGSVQLVLFASGSSVSTGDGTEAIAIPASFNGLDLIDALATVHTQGVTGTTDVQVRRRRAGSDVDMLSTEITIAAEYYVNDGVIDTANDDVQTGDQIYIDVDAIHSGTAPLGLTVVLSFG